MGLIKLAAAILALVAVVAGVVWVSRSLNDSPEEEAYGYFLRDSATAQAQGVPVYWLGQEFTAGDLVFRGPYGAEFGAEVEEGISVDYLAPVDGGNVAFGLTIYSRDAWERVKENIRNPKIPGVTRRTASIGAREGELLSLPLATREVNQLWLLLDMEDVVVVAVAHSGGPLYPGGPDYNPFINDPDLLIQVMEDLRPYPE
jgi:hypothetical protein